MNPLHIVLLHYPTLCIKKRAKFCPLAIKFPIIRKFQKFNLNFNSNSRISSSSFQLQINKLTLHRTEYFISSHNSPAYQKTSLNCQNAQSNHQVKIDTKIYTEETDLASKSSRIDCSSGVHSVEIPELCRSADAVCEVSITAGLLPPLLLEFTETPFAVDFCAADEPSWLLLLPTGFALAAISKRHRNFTKICFFCLRMNLFALFFLQKKIQYMQNKVSFFVGQVEESS